MVVTCKNITSLPYANQLKLLAGKDALDHPITWVYYMEDPFYVDWLKGGELIITTGLVTKEDSEKLIDMIDAQLQKILPDLLSTLEYIFQKFLKR